MSGSGSREKRRVVSESGQEMTPPSLFLAMTALIIAQVSGVQAEIGNYSYWAYVLNPPLNKAVGWEDASVVVYVNDSNWMPGLQMSLTTIVNGLNSPIKRHRGTDRIKNKT